MLHHLNLFSMLENKNVFITGASGGLGAYIAKEFARYGCNLYLTGREEKRLIEAIDRLRSLMQVDKKVYFKTGDLQNDNDIYDLIRDAKSKFKNIDILINCAGVFIVNPIGKTDDQSFDNCFNVNVKAPFIFCREFITDMARNKWGRIINIGSSSSYSGFKETSAYCASKHALLGLTRSLHDEYKQDNVRAFCFSPGSIKTEMGRKVKNQDFETFIDPQEIARYIAFSISFDGEMVSDEVRLNRVNVQ